MTPQKDYDPSYLSLSTRIIRQTGILLKSFPYFPHKSLIQVESMYVKLWLRASASDGTFHIILCVKYEMYHVELILRKTMGIRKA